jgi:putative aminopeptidase FrvX
MAPLEWSGFEVYERLASKFAPPGMEGPVRDELQDLLSRYTSLIEIDSIGNLYAYMGTAQGPRVMVTAHMDEVALVVSDINERGSLHVIPQGLLSAENFYKQPVMVLGSKGPILGIADIADSHEKALLQNVTIDVGVQSRREVSELGIRCGDRVCFSPQIRPLGRDKIVGKSADDRTGLYVLSEVARRLEGKELAIQLVLVGTVQEEGVDTFVAWAGARVATRKLAPALALGIDTVEAWDWIPNRDRRGKPRVHLSDGLGILRGAQDLHPGLVDYLIARASQNQLQHQIIPISATAADYTTISRSREGVPCAGVAIPIRHPHSSMEIFKWKTVEDTVTLLLDLLAHPGDLLEIAKKLH